MDGKEIILVGDVHGKIIKLINNINDIQLYNDYNYILLGDVGFKAEYNLLQSYNYSNIKVLFGNHDYYPYLNESISLGDFRCLEYKDLKVMFMRGGISIDKNKRFLNIDYFIEEDYNYETTNKILDCYERFKPDIVVSHVLPTSISFKLFDYDENYHINNVFDECLNIHKPLQWICGHYHRSLNKIIDDVEYRILNELEFYIL